MMIATGTATALEVSSVQALGELITALIAAEGEFTEIIKDKPNPYFKSMYADFPNIVSATAPALRKHGLVIIQDAETNAETRHVLVYSTLWHKNGAHLACRPIGMPAVAKAEGGKEKYDAQSVTGATTYGKRVAWAMLLGIAAEDDDDGNTLQNTAVTPKKPKYEPQPGIPKAANPDAPTKEELQAFSARAKKYTEEILPKMQIQNPSKVLLKYILKKTGVEDSKLLTKKQWSDTLDDIDRAYAVGSLADLLFLKEILG